MFFGIYPYRVWPYWVPSIPKLYYDSESMEQRIKYLCKEYDHLIQYLEYLSDELSKADIATQAEFETFTKYVKNEITSMKDTISHMEAGSLIWDVTSGQFEANIEAMRDTVRWLSIYAIDCDELTASGYTVATLATCGLNVRGLATFGQWLYHNSDPIPGGLGV